MKQNFEMVAKTFRGLEDVLAGELRNLGAENVEPGLRMVSFEGDLEMLYKANLCCRTALRILKPICKFIARDTDALYEMIKEINWSDILTLDKTFAIDSVVYSDEFTNSRFVTYRAKDAIVDYFKDRFGPDKRPGVRQQGADVLINVHIAGDRVTVSLDSSGESLHKRGYRVAQTEAPINEVLAAGIILLTGWHGEKPFIDPMCGSGTFIAEAALIAANIMPGIYRRGFAFEQWKDFDRELFESLYNDDSAERPVTCPIIGADISPKAIETARRNLRSAGVARYVTLATKPFQQWEEVPAGGILVTNPPYGERISAPDMEGLYAAIGSKLKHVFQGYHAWIIGYREEYFRKIGLAPSSKVPILNGPLECELREYVIFDGELATFRREGGRLKEGPRHHDDRKQRRRLSDNEWRAEARAKGFGGKEAPRRGLTPAEPRNNLERAYRPTKGRFSRRKRYSDRDDTPQSPDSENPLAERRNPSALKNLINKRPSLPAPEEKVFMRERRGWRK